jgi:hypothetical protein
VSTPWIVAFGFLSACVTLVALVLLGTLRRISAVLEQAEARLREMQTSAGPGGLESGSRLPVFRVQRFAGGWVSDDDLRGSAFLVVFVSSSCPACSELVRGIRRSGGDFALPTYIVVSSPEEVHLLGLDETRNVLIQADGDLSRAFRTTTTPHAFAFDSTGIVAAASTPNTLRQLEELVQNALRPEGGDSGHKLMDVVGV